MADVIRCPIKINLILRVFSKLPNGYHEIYSLFWQKTAAERLTIRPKYDEIIGDSLNIEGMKIEGENLVAEAAGHRADMETILIRDGYSGPLPGGTARNILTVDRGLFDKLADTRTSQGIMAIVRKPVFSSEEFIRIVRDAVLRNSGE